MGIMAKASAALARLEAPRDVSGLANPSSWLWDALGSRKTASGIRITDHSAMRQAAVFACVRTLAEDVASLPCITYRRSPDGRRRERATDHRIYDKLKYSPNPEIDAFKFWELTTAYAALGGNYYAEIEWDNGGVPRALWPIPPSRVQHDRTPDGRRIYRIWTDKDGPRVLFDYEMFHVAGIGLDTDGRGMSVISAASQGIALALGAEEYGARFFANDARPGGAVKVPKQLSEPAYKRLKDSWDDGHRGLENAHRIALLEEGAEWQQIGISAKDSQLLEVRQYQTVEIARIFRVPPHKIGEVDRSTSWGSGIEQQEIAYVIHALRSWLRRIEHRIRRSLIPQNQERTMYAEFLVEEHFRGDSASRAAFYKEMFALGVMSINDILAKENMNPIGPLGDLRFVSHQMKTLEEAAKPEPAPTPAPPAPPALPAGTPDKAEEANARAKVIEALGRMATQSETIAQMYETLHSESGERHVELVSVLSGIAGGQSGLSEAVRALPAAVVAEGEETRAETLTETRAAIDAVRETLHSESGERHGEIVTALAGITDGQSGLSEAVRDLPAVVVAGDVETRQAITVAAEKVSETLRTESEARHAELASALSGITDGQAGLSDAVRALPAVVVAGSTETREAIDAVRDALPHPATPDEQRIIAARRLLWSDTMRRLVRKESSSARKAAGKRDAFVAWCETWYDRHEIHVRESIRGVVALDAAYSGASVDTEEEADRLAADHVGESRRQLLDLFSRIPAENFAEVIANRMARWEAERADRIVDAIVHKEMSRVR